MARPRTNAAVDPPRRRRSPAKTPEARENQMISLAERLAEEQLENGTASAQVITHYLKLASTRERLEEQRLIHENELLAAKTQQIASQERLEELTDKALNAFRAYSGQDTGEDRYDD